ncbi:hypothetical protein GCM10010377_39270 [Streptomyces viridiviolaceus]|nr:hypothetical protein GCM10010377_39270 [Streptomyces viridiviolaceus]
MPRGARGPADVRLRRVGATSHHEPAARDETEPRPEPGAENYPKADFTASASRPATD